jgi:hypothetical protein
VDGLDSLL